MKRSDTYTFDEVYKIVIAEGFPTTKCALKQVEFTLARVRADGGHLIKFIHDKDLGPGRDRLRGEVRRLLRAERKTGRIILMIRGEDFSMSDTATRYLADKCPQVQLDPDMDRGNENITVVYF